MNNGRCYICNDIYKDGGITRHIKSCLEKTKGARTTSDEADDNTYLIKIQDKYDSGYYLYLLIDGCVFLSEIDQYIRDIWVECCGHLSCFILDGIRYERYPDYEWEETEDMSSEINEILYPGASFYYEYDYGSTTELKLKVVEIYEPLFSSKGIHLIGRNMPREFKCDYCDNKAKMFFEDVYSGENGVICDSCSERIESEYKEIYFRDIINSPRLGVCGYDGPTDDILFMKHKGIGKRKRRKTTGKQENKLVLDKDKLAVLGNLSGKELIEDDITDHADLMKVLYDTTRHTKYRPYSTPPFVIDGLKLDKYMLKDCLGALRKTELDTIRKNLDVDLPLGAKKAELVEHINQFLLENIEDVMAYLPPVSYAIVMEICESEDFFFEEIEDIPELLDNLRCKGILFSIYEYLGEYEWVVPDDIKMILEKLEENEDFQKKRMFSDEIYKIILSVLYYWGVVSRCDLMKETARLLDIDDNDDEFINILIEIINNMETYIESDVIGGKTYYNILAEDAGAIVLSPQWKNADYSPIEKDMIPEEDEGWLGLVLHNPYFKWLYDVLEQGGNEKDDFDEEYLYEALFAMVQTTLNAKPEINIRKFAKELGIQDIIFKSPLTEELLNNILLYTPNYWIKGNSISGEIHVNNNQFRGWDPRITPLGNLNKSQGKKPVETAASRWNVGWNDLCPCGSGKKYKKCCGK